MSSKDEGAPVSLTPEFFAGLHLCQPDVWWADPFNRVFLGEVQEALGEIGWQLVDKSSVRMSWEIYNAMVDLKGQDAP